MPIQLELNSVASRASHAANHPAAGSCCSPGDVTAGPAPAATLGKGENTWAWNDTRGAGVRMAPGFSLWVVPMARWGIFCHCWCVGYARQCIARRWCWDPAPLALAGHRPGCRASGMLGFPGSCQLWGAARGSESGEGDARSCLVRSRWKTREPWVIPGRILPREKHALFLVPGGVTPASSLHTFCEISLQHFVTSETRLILTLVPANCLQKQANLMQGICGMLSVFPKVEDSNKNAESR